LKRDARAGVNKLGSFGSLAYLVEDSLTHFLGLTMSRSLFSFFAAFTGLLVIFCLIATQFDEGLTLQAQATVKAELPLEFQYVPNDAALFLSVDVAQLLDNPIIKAIRKADGKTFEDLTSAAKMAFGLTPDDVKSVVVFVPQIKKETNQYGLGIAITFGKAYEKEKLARGAELLLSKRAKIQIVELTDRKALVLVNLEDEFAKPQPVGQTGPMTQTLQLAACGKHACVLGMTPANFPEVLRNDNVSDQIRGIQPLFKAVSITGTLNLGKSLDLNVQVKTPTAGQAVECEKALGFLLTMIEEGLGEQLKTVEAEAVKKPTWKDLATTMKAGSTALKKAKFSTLGTETQLTLSLGADLPFVGAYLAMKDVMNAEQEVNTSANNLKQIAIALHSYSDAMNGNMPPAAVCDKTGKPLLSWRVLILPYIGQETLFKEFKLDEPWDSAHNKKLLVKMPKVYALPGKARPGETETFYRVFVGNDAGFDWIQGARFPADFPDGTSNTIMCVTAAESVHWTKPDELEFDPKKDMRKLIGMVANGRAQISLFDGSVRTYKTLPSKETTHAAITRSGGEVLGEDF
jgi:hypothetical protein